MFTDIILARTHATPYADMDCYAYCFLFTYSFSLFLLTILRIKRSKYFFLQLSDEGTKIWKCLRDLISGNNNINYCIILKTCFSIIASFTVQFLQ